MQFPIDWPEVTRIHLARAGTAGLDGGLVHRLDARGTNRGQLRLIDRHEQRGRLPRVGKGLLKDALRRTVAAADIAGIRAIFVTAKDDDARRFYEHYNFDPSPGDPHELFLVMKDLKKMLV